MLFFSVIEPPKPADFLVYFWSRKTPKNAKNVKKCGCTRVFSIVQFRSIVYGENIHFFI